MQGRGEAGFLGIQRRGDAGAARGHQRREGDRGVGGGVAAAEVVAAGGAGNPAGLGEGQGKESVIEDAAAVEVFNGPGAAAEGGGVVLHDFVRSGERAGGE